MSMFAPADRVAKQWRALLECHQCGTAMPDTSKATCSDGCAKKLARRKARLVRDARKRRRRNRSK